MSADFVVIEHNETTDPKLEGWLPVPLQIGEQLNQVWPDSRIPARGASPDLEFPADVSAGSGAANNSWFIDDQSINNAGGYIHILPPVQRQQARDKGWTLEAELMVVSSNGR